MNDKTLLLRQIHPSFIQGDRVTSQAFTPTPKDNRQLSVYDGDQITASAAFDHFTSQPNCRSHGVYAVQVSECLEYQLIVRPDPAPYPEHVVVDFGDRTDKSIKTVAKALREKAEVRGWMHTASQ